jgi:hypothetical protein
VPSFRPRRLIVAIAIALVVAGCSNGASPVVVPGVVPTKLTVGLGYIPSVQFAAFYRADQAGYYANEGLAITFQNEIDANLVPKVGANTLDLGLSDGTSVIPAASQGIPIKYLATIYGKFPSIVFAKATSGITTAADLKGRKIGIPGKYGSSWVMLQALLASANLTVDDATIVLYRPGGGRRRDRLHQQRACPADHRRDARHRPAGRRRHAAARSRDHRLDRDDHRKADGRRGIHPRDLQGDERDRNDAVGRGRCRDQGGPGSREGSAAPGGDPQRDDRRLASERRRGGLADHRRGRHGGLGQDHHVHDVARLRLEAGDGR